jgi:membrane protease YdiL (CAAX protease family)
VRRSLALLWSDLNDLFGEREATFWFLMAAGALLQAGFWYLASPGPGLIAFEGRLPLTALKNVVLTTAFLLIAPAILARAVGVKLPDARFSLGAPRIALPLVLVLWLLTLLPLWAAAGSADFQATYPWPGAWAGTSLIALASWLATYVLYYVAFEAFYRGFLLRLVASRYGLVTGIWFQALAATLIHVGKPLPELLTALPASLIFGVLAVRGRSLLYPLLLHWLIGATTDIFILQRLGALLP